MVRPRSRSLWRVRSVVWPLAWLLALALGCSSLPSAPKEDLELLVWPAENPRVRLSEVISLEASPHRGSRRWLRLLVGSQGAQSSGSRRPYAVAWDGEDLLVADPDARRLVRIGPGGRVRPSPRGFSGQPIGLAVCSKGIAVTDSQAGTLSLLDEDFRNPRRLAENLLRPTGIVCDGSRIIIAETGRHRLLIFEGDGSQHSLGRRGTGLLEFNFPTSLALAGGTLWVGDALNFRVQAIDLATGVAQASFGRLGDAPGEMPRIKGIAVDSEGHLWIADAHLDRVSIFTAEGDLLTSIGGPGAAAGTFSFPAGVAAHPDGRVAVVDSFNRRLQIFQPVAPRRGEGS